MCPIPVVAFPEGLLTSTPDRRYAGLRVFVKAVERLPLPLTYSILSPNLVRCLVANLGKPNNLLSKAASKAVRCATVPHAKDTQNSQTHAAAAETLGGCPRPGRRCKPSWRAPSKTPRWPSTRLPS